MNKGRVCSALLVVALSVTAPLASAQQDQAPTKPKKAKKICRTDETVVGSRLAPRVCLTAEQWAERAGKPISAGGRSMENVERVERDGQSGN